MLLGREFQPAKDQLLYHYCSAESFLSICRTKRVRFSDIFSMNDSQEMHWGYSIFEKAASRLLPNITKEFFNEVDDVFQLSGYNLAPTISCFSQAKDLLSQWRAYGDDGAGYCIGFDANFLTKLPCRPLVVEYDEEKQINEVSATLTALYQTRQLQELSSINFDDMIKVFAVDICSLKHPSFAEEREIRLIHVLNFCREGDFLFLKDIGGEAWGKNHAGTK
jgi:Protein of unknown function (DUF2971)